MSLTADSIIDPGKAGRLWPGLSLDLLHNPPLETDELDVTDVSAYTPSKLAPVAKTSMPQPTASNSGNIQISITSDCNFDISLLDIKKGRISGATLMFSFLHPSCPHL